MEHELMKSTTHIFRESSLLGSQNEEEHKYLPTLPDHDLNNPF
jgi:hypothetical protein